MKFPWIRLKRSHVIVISMKYTYQLDQHCFTHRLVQRGVRFDDIDLRKAWISLFHSSSSDHESELVLVERSLLQSCLGIC